MSDENGELGADQEGTELEEIQRSLASLGTRIDSLVTSTTSYRSALTDRLREYAELVATLTEAQADELEEHRQANERALSELRQSLTASEASIERVGTRIDALVADVESTDDASRRVLAEVRTILDAQESLGRFLTESIDRFADDVTNRLAASEQAAADRAEQVRTATTESESIATLLDELRTTLQDLASGEVVGALWDEFRELRTDVGAVTGVSAEISQLRVTLDDLVARVDAAVEADPGPDARLPDEVARLDETVRTLLTDVSTLREDLAAGLVVEASDDMGTALEALQRQVGAACATIDPDVVDLLREEIRASGEPAEGLIVDLNTELRALRRRIRLRAEGEILGDAQLEAIAESVARRLAADG